MRYKTNSFFLLVSKRNIDISTYRASKYRVKIAISSKIVKTAVKRNRIKRLVKEVLRFIDAQNKISGKEFVIGIKKDVSSETYDFFLKEISDLFKKVGLEK